MANVELNIEFDSHAQTYWLSALQREQYPYAVSLALNNVAFMARKNLQEEIKRVFDKPTPWTLRTPVVIRANKKRWPIKAIVELDTWGDKATAPAKAIGHQVFGGERHEKRSEKALRSIGVLGADEMITPGVAARLDAYGNVTRSQITKMLSGLKAFSEVGFNANATTSARSQAKGNAKTFVAIKPRGGNRPKAIYIKQGRSLAPFMNIVKSPKYNKRLAFYEIVQHTADTNLQTEYSKAMDYAIATALKK